ncbi:D-alanyl-D-alanine carboxypeptidase family protein [Sediminibacillus dalangtanensis]|uniref:D-alanyl-D-alanine carboxypeptidase family protein n=1 Tax=Sediminibacillus dalangtanensis TaxID=2729421 RepID=A0ABX7VT02_9BACI|nr:M15 family metallopeptidase [Sediminibacillus dalangtanensis]QTM98593.1 D-alanyl-D-alanine carboxypeptidase family protein [Sediminibacillus dalangtanensis]
MKGKALLITAALGAVLFGCQQNEEPKQGEDTKASQTELDDKQASDQSDSQDGNQESERDQAGQKGDENSENSSGNLEKPEDGEVVTVEDPESTLVLVNKQFKLPDGYEPPDLIAPDVPFYFDEDLEKRYMREEAAHALEDLFNEAEEAGLDLVAASGYRSYERQEEIYQQNVDSMGQEEADKFSARPGNSEHQTGLAMDVTSAEMAFSLEQSFKQTDEGTWLAENAHHYGFIIRYPEGKDHITGYSYEPWHIRYVGEKAAEKIYQQDLTLEEYLFSE